jgi:hypothetical protein
MKKICLSVVGMFLTCFGSFAQSNPSDSTDYKNLNLKLAETNIVSSYYSQSGNHSAITGGIGTQQLTDIGTSVNLKFVNWNMFDKNGASRKGGTRFYPSLSYKIEDEAKGTTFGFGASYSSEYTYHSIGANFIFNKKSNNGNSEFDLKGQVYIDKVKLVEPSELRPPPAVNTRASRSNEKSLTPSSPRNTADLTLSLSQVISKRTQVALIAEGVGQQGYLSLPFHRVYFTNGSVHLENLPDTRFKLPLGIRLNYFAGDKVIIRTYYRFYTDSWGVTSHTASIETPVKVTPFVSISPFYRYYIQTAAHYFAPYEKHTAAETYYTSNYDYSAFSTNYAGVNLRFAPPKGVFGVSHFSVLELRYGFYKQTTGLKAQNITLNLQFK